MGQGGHITLVNGTDLDWRRIQQDSYQMNTWKFPEVIKAGSSVDIYVEFKQNIFENSHDDVGHAAYELGSTGHTFNILADAKKRFMLSIIFTNLATPGNKRGSILPIGWRHNGFVQFILSGNREDYNSSNMPSSWMHDNLKTLGGRQLRNLCVPGSHDAGMSECVHGTAFAYKCNTVTQTESIKGQLQCGVRYFDIRPVISGGNYFTGHYSHIEKIQSWQGACGQSMESIIEDVNAYTQHNKETVVLYFSHDLNTDLGNNSYAPFNKSEWHSFFDMLKKINFRTDYSTVSDIDLTVLTLNTLIGKGEAAVIIVVDPSDDNINFHEYMKEGIYGAHHFPVINKYSDTNEMDKMASDQIAKMKKYRTSAKAEYFLLSWTLTQDDTEATTCEFGTAKSVLDLADEADPHIYTDVINECNKDCFPNVLYMDAASNPNMAALALAINCKSQ